MTGKMPKGGAAVLLGGFLLASSLAQARVNLPQIRQVVALPEESVRAIQTHLSTATASGHELPSSAEALLLGALPQEFRDACGDLIENWGEIARGTVEWKVRLLHQEADRMWLAFRCRSRAPEYVNDYDERPAVLHLGARTLELFPLASDSSDDSTLYHLEFAETVPLEGAQGLAFKVTEPAGNPCCDGPESRSGERWMVFAETPHGVAELLSVVTARDDSSHSDDPEIDSETIYRGQITLQRGPQVTVREVVATFKEEEKEVTWDGEKSTPRTVSQRSGTLRYRWNPASLRFEEMK
jgi:hypothetical protein